MSRYRPAIVFGMTGAAGLCGGIATANLNILQALASLARDAGGSLDVLSLLESDANRPAFLPPEVHFRGFSGARGKFARTLLRTAFGSSFTCLDHVTLALPLLPLAAARRVRTVIFTHGSESWRRVRRTSRWSFRHAALCLANSEYTLRRMRAVGFHFRGAACPLGLSPLMPLHDKPPARRPSEVCLEAADGEVRPLGPHVLLLVGRMDSSEREKGHRSLIACLPRLRPEFPDTQLVFAGPGDDREALAGAAREAGVADAVFMPGQVSVATLSDLYCSCYAYVMPSRQEGFGLVYLEAMNQARACVGCTGDGAEDVIVDGETGILVRDPNDQDELTSALLRILGEEAMTEEMGRKGFARLHAGFTARHYQDRICAHLRPLLTCG